MFDRLVATLRLWFRPERVKDEGSTPDYRFSLANERTFLAWVRTALALVAGGIAVDQFLTQLRWGFRTTVAILLLAGAVACAVRSINHWARCERAMRCGTDLPGSRFPVWLALSTALASVIVVGAVVLGWAGR